MANCRTGLIYPYVAPDGRKGALIPYGILIVAAILRQAGEDVSFVDRTFSKGDDSKLVAMAQQCDIIGTYVTSPLVPFAATAIKAARKTNPDITVIAGGPECYVNPDKILEIGADVVVNGEGEFVVSELVHALRNGLDLSTVKGICFFDKGKLVRNSPAPLVKDLDTVPFAAFDLVDYASYAERGLNTVPISSARGCPFNCTFCQPLTRDIFGRAVRRRSPKVFVDEIEYRLETICAKWPSLITINDETFTYDKKYVFEVCAEIRRRGLTFPWTAPTRVDCVSDEMLAAMRDVGCEKLWFGVESGSQKILDFYKKGIKPQQVVEAFRLARKNGIKRYGFFIIGAPDETEQDLCLTEKLIREIRPDGVSVTRLTPKPGSFIEEYATAKGIHNVQRADEFFHNNSGYPLKLNHLSQSDLDRWEKHLLEVAKSVQPD